MQIKLTELEPQFVTYGERDVEGYGKRETQADVGTLAEAHGIRFLCPACFQKNGGPVGTHAIVVTFAGRGVPDHLGSQGDSGPSRWQVSGTGYDDLTLSPSIDISRRSPGEWHGFITNGVAQ